MTIINDRLEKQKKGGINMKNRKVWKVMFIILAIAIILFLIHTIRNVIIVTDLQNKISQYTNSNNYYVKVIANQEDGVVIINDNYRKDDRILMTIEKNDNGEIEKKTFNVKATQTPNKIYEHLKTDNNWQTFIYSAMARITSEEYNGKQCYRIDNFLSQYFINDNIKNVVYIEKDTGLTLKLVTDKEIVMREYEFNTVDDSVFKNENNIE